MKTYSVTIKGLPMTFMPRKPDDPSKPCVGCALLAVDECCASDGFVGCGNDILIAADEATKNNAMMLKVAKRLRS